MAAASAAAAPADCRSDDHGSLEVGAEREALFAECSALAQRLGLAELSMGMSGDWPEAAAAGSTWVRVGSALFGPKL